MSPRVEDEDLKILVSTQGCNRMGSLPELQVIDEDPDTDTAISRGKESVQEQIPDRIRIPQVVLKVNRFLGCINEGQASHQPIRRTTQGHDARATHGITLRAGSRSISGDRAARRGRKG